MRPLTGFLAALVPTATAIPVHAAVRWVSEVTSEGETVVLVVAIDGAHLRMEGSAPPRPGPGGVVDPSAPPILLYESSTAVLTMLDPVHASYVAMSLAAPPADPSTALPNVAPGAIAVPQELPPELQQRIENAARAREAQRAALEAALARLPPAQRQRMEETMRARLQSDVDQLSPEKRQQMAEATRGRPVAGVDVAAPPRVFEFRPTGDHRTIAGLTCDVTRVVEGASVVEEDCLLPWGAGPVTREDLPALVDLAGRWASAGEPATDLRGFPGFPLVRKILDPVGTPVATTTITRIERVAITPSTFEVPAGYHRAARAPRAP